MRRPLMKSCLYFDLGFGAKYFHVEVVFEFIVKFYHVPRIRCYFYCWPLQRHDVQLLGLALFAIPLYGC